MIKENKDFIVIDFTGLFKTLIRKLWVIVLVGVIGAAATWGGASVYAKSLEVVPMYRSTAKLYVTGNVVLNPSANEKLLGQSFFADYCELMKSEKVTSYVIENLQLNMTKKELLNCVSTKWVSGTCMAYVTVTFPDAQMAKAIVDDIVRVTSAYALEVIGMAVPVIYEEATVPTSPSTYVNSMSTKKYVILGAAGSAAIALMFVVLQFLFDKKVRTPEQFTERLSLPVYSAVTKKKAKKAVYNRRAMQYLYGQIYLTKKNARTIGFVAAGKEKKQDVIAAYYEYLKEIGKKAVVLDTDLLHPVGTDGNGFVEFLKGKQVKLEELVFEKDGMKCIACSEVAWNTMELLDGPRFEELLKELLTKYDYILVNAAAAECISEVRIVLDKTDVNLLLVECAKSTYPSCESFLEKCDGEKLTAAVFSNVKLKKHNKEFKKSFGAYFGIK